MRGDNHKRGLQLGLWDPPVRALLAQNVLLSTSRHLSNAIQTDRVGGS